MTRTFAVFAIAVALAAAGAALAGCATPPDGEMTRIDSAGEFQSQVLAADKPVVVEFYKTLCPACVMLEPTLNELAGQYEGRVRFFRVEAAGNTELAGRYRIRSAPTVLLFADGREQGRWVNEHNRNVYTKALDEALSGSK